MKYRAAVVDTNVVVAGFLTPDRASPTARIVEAMVKGSFPFLLSSALLAEYRAVLLRSPIRARHGLTEREVDSVLGAIATHAVVREPEPRKGAPDPKDAHVWSLAQSEPATVLVTGGRALTNTPPPSPAVLQPREFADSLSD